jgi:sugar phosphate isomerase/epimerase
MTTRRSFIKSSSLVSAGFLVGMPRLDRKTKLIGLQLYTVRDAMGKDPADTLAKVAKIGFNSLEGATYTGTQNFYGLAPAEFAKLLKDNGLVMPSSHYRLGEEQANGAPVKGTILHEWDRAVEDAARVGIKYMVCAYLSADERKGLDHYKMVADQLNQAGEKCRKAGIQLCYHNHDFEFMKQDGQYPYDILLSTDKDLVKMEMDIYWVKKAGMDPVALIDKHPGRFPLFHLKDMDNTAEHAFTEVGNGVIDFKSILKHQDKAGLQYFFVEQDKCPGSPFDSIAKSYAYIQKNLI